MSDNKKLVYLSITIDTEQHYIKQVPHVALSETVNSFELIREDDYIEGATGPTRRLKKTKILKPDTIFIQDTKKVSYHVWYIEEEHYFVDVYNQLLDCISTTINDMNINILKLITNFNKFKELKP